MTKLLFSLLLFLTIGPELISQNVAAWEDRRGRLQYYDNGVITQLDHQQGERYGAGSFDRFHVGGDFIIYHNNRDEIVYYRSGYEETLHLRDVLEDYSFSQHLVTIDVGGVFQVLNHKTKETLNLAEGTEFLIRDSIVAFVDYAQYFKVYFRGEIHNLDGRDLGSFKLSDNSCAWTDSRMGMFKFFMEEETYEVADLLPNEYKVGRDFLLYLDDYDEFFIWRDDESTSIDDYPPNSWKVGDNIAAYIDEDDNFLVIDEGSIEPTELLASAPNFYDIVDNTLIYVDDANYLNVYYKGKNHLLEYYNPDKIKYYDGIVAYTDDNGRLKAFYEGEVMPVSDNIITDFKVQGRVILYEYGNGDYMIFHNGQNFYQN